MVYRGKPSLGCANCRRRKIKCNGGKPECSQCVRIGQTCPGYRNQLDLLFLDQSDDVKSKFHVQAQKKTDKGMSKGVERQVEDSVNALVSISKNQQQLCPDVTQTESVPAMLELGIEDHACGFFFRHYVLESQHGRTYNDYLPALYSRESSSYALHCAVTAVGMAGLACNRSSRSLRLQARKQYSLALSSTNAALRDRSLAVRDETLASILILGLYEESYHEIRSPRSANFIQTITMDSQQSMASWHKHISGCMALIELRGVQQFQGEFGLKLFQQWRSQVLIQCLRTRQPVPVVVEEWTRMMKASVNFVDETSSSRLSSLVSRLASLDVENDDKTLYERCKHLDDDFADWARDFRFRVPYDIVPISGPRWDVWGSEYHIYKDVSCVHQLNIYRASRLMLNDRLIVHSSANLYNSAMIAQYELSQATVSELSLEILASVPFILGVRHDSVIDPPASGAFAIVWHLFIVASAKDTSYPIRHWIVDRLAVIGRTLGFHKAIALATVIQRRDEKIAQIAMLASKLEQVSVGTEQSVDSNPDRLSRQAFAYLQEMPHESEEDH